MALHRKRGKNRLANERTINSPNHHFPVWAVFSAYLAYSPGNQAVFASCLRNSTLKTVRTRGWMKKAKGKLKQTGFQEIDRQGQKVKSGIVWTVRESGDKAHGGAHQTHGDGLRTHRLK